MRNTVNISTEINILHATPYAKRPYHTAKYDQEANHRVDIYHAPSKHHTFVQ